MVGCGAWEHNILRDLQKLHAHVYVADIDQKARNKALKSGAASVFSSSTELPDSDGYVIAVPIPLLSSTCLTLLPRRKPIFSEKTLILFEEDYYKLKDLGGDKFIFSMHKWQYHPGIEKLREIAQSEQFGKILRSPVLILHYWGLPGFLNWKINLSSEFFLPNNLYTPGR